jgi:hypothetical protein
MNDKGVTPEVTNTNHQPISPQAESTMQRIGGKPSWI